MAGLFGGGQAPTQTTQFKMSPEQKQVFNMAMPYLTQYGQNPGGPYTGQTIASQNPTQGAAMDLGLNAAGGQQTLSGNAAGANNWLLGGEALFPGSNPALQGTIDAANRSVNDNLFYGDLPAIRGEAITTGNFGSSRQGLAEGRASAGASQARGDNASRIASAGYGQGLDAMTRSLGLAPQTGASLLQPAQTTGAVGDSMQAYQQLILDDMVNKYYQQQQFPLSVGKELMGVVGGMPGGTNVSTGTAPQGSPIASGIGGALTMAGAGFGPLGMAAGGGLGALLGFL